MLAHFNFQVSLTRLSFSQDQRYKGLCAKFDTYHEV